MAEQLPEPLVGLEDGSQEAMERLQASLYHARERRRSFVGRPELFKTHTLGGKNGVMEEGNIPTDILFGSRTAPTTFETAIRVTGSSPAGLVVELGGLMENFSIWVNNGYVGTRAGDDVGLQGHIFINATNYPVLTLGQYLHIMVAVQAGGGWLALWLDGKRYAKVQAPLGSFPAWAGTDVGNFAKDGEAPGDVPVTTAPVDFDVVEPMSVYFGSTPRDFLI